LSRANDAWRMKKSGIEKHSAFQSPTFLPPKTGRNTKIVF
jgi:hypothetical protein